MGKDGVLPRSSLKLPLPSGAARPRLDVMVTLADACLQCGAAPDRIVGMIEYQGRMLVATERHVFQLQDGKFIPIIFASPLHEPAPVATAAAGHDSNGENGREPGQVPS